MFKMINENNSSQISINSSVELLEFFEKDLKAKNVFAKAVAGKTKKCIAILTKDKDKWFDALDLLASITGNGGYKFKELQESLLSLDTAFFHVE